MKRSFSVVANSGHLHMYLWGELHGGIRALGLSLCQSEDFVLTKASHDIAGIDLSGFQVRIGVYIAIAFRTGVRSRVGIGVGVGIAINIAAAVSFTAAISFASASTFASALGLAANLGKLLVA